MTDGKEIITKRILCHCENTTIHANTEPFDNNAAAITRGRERHAMFYTKDREIYFERCVSVSQGREDHLVA